MLKITPQAAKAFLLGHHRLHRFAYQPSSSSMSQLLSDLTCIQLDPLSPMGTSPDMVIGARMEGFRFGTAESLLYPGKAFEHFAKERCLLPQHAFPYYRDRAVEVPWWRLNDRMQRLPAGVVEAVYAEVRERGPLTPGQLSSHGRVEPLDYSGWKSTAKAERMALEVLWTQCKVVTVGKKGREKWFDIPERALPNSSQPADQPFNRWALLQRVKAAGLLSQAGGPHWSMLSSIRTSPLPARLVEEGLICEVMVEGSNRRFYAPAQFETRTYGASDNAMRILAPLDPMLWDRKLIKHVFDFDYVWEVYKPREKRRWGWYVCPLLHRGQLVGRLEGRAAENGLEILNIWEEPGHGISRPALLAALDRQAAACGVKKVRLPKGYR